MVFALSVVLILFQAAVVPAGEPDSLRLRVEAKSLRDAIKTASSREELFRLHRAAIKKYRLIGDKGEEATELLYMGGDYFFYADYEKSLESLFLSLELFRELGRHRAVADVYNTLGAVYLALSDYQKALELFQRSYEIKRDTKQHYLESRQLGQIGNVHCARAEYDKALACYEQALKIARDKERKGLEGTQLSNIGGVYSATSDYSKALAHYLRSAEIFEEIQSSWDEGNTARNIGIIYTKLGNYVKAKYYIARALAIALRLKTHGEIQQAYSALGDCYSAQGLDFLAVVNYANAIETVENIRSRLTLESHQSGYMARVADIYKKIVASLVKLGREEEAFDYIERMKARALLDILEGGRIDFTGMMTAAEAQREKSLIARIETLNRSVAEAKTGEEGTPDSLSAALEHSREALEAFQEKLYMTHPELKKRRGRGKPVTFKDAGKIPGADEAVIYYIVADDRLLLFILTREGLETARVEIKEQALNGRIDTFLAGITRYQETLDVSFWNEAASGELYRLMIAPVLKFMEGKKRICVIPDGRLNRLPFHALKDETSGRYLAEDFTVYYTPSLSTLRELRSTGRNDSSGLIAFGNPQFGKESELVASLRGELAPLPDTEKEVIALEKIYHPKARVFLGNRAAESNFKKFHRDYGVIHFATHAIVNETSPMYSAIALSREEGEDGFLEAREIIQMDLRANIAVLSACKTAYGKVMEGEGMLGLSRAFFSAGVTSIIASLWMVDDRATSALMVEFHKNLHAGMQPPSALREAELHLLRETEHKNPLLWAPFVVIGDAAQWNDESVISSMNQDDSAGTKPPRHSLPADQRSLSAGESPVLPRRPVCTTVPGTIGSVRCARPW